MLGYVLEEVNRKWLVPCINNEIMYISLIKYSRFTYEQLDLEIYLYELPIKCASSWIETYWPIRIRVTKNAVQNCILMMSQFVFKDDKVYEQLSS